MSLDSGLYMTATPIGNLADISKRASDVLEAADLIVCEDTRQTGKLLAALGIDRAKGTLRVYNDHSGAAEREALLDRLAGGAAIACVSDAGTPLISDPGYKLVRAARAAGYAVYTVPGPSSLAAALSVAGQPTDRVLFRGFVPGKDKAREDHFKSLLGQPVTSVHFETAPRLVKSLRAVRDILGPDQEITVCRELTKLHEETQAGTIEELLSDYSGRDRVKGEIVLVLAPAMADAPEDISDEALARAIAEGADRKVKDLARELSDRFGLSRSLIYERILEHRGRK